MFLTWRSATRSSLRCVYVSVSPSQGCRLGSITCESCPLLRGLVKSFSSNSGHTYSSKAISVVPEAHATMAIRAFLGRRNLLRRLFWPDSVRHLVHVRHRRTTWVVMDICTCLPVLFAFMVQRIHCILYQIVEGLATVAVAILAFFGKCLTFVKLIQSNSQRMFDSVRRSSRHSDFPHCKRTHILAQSTEYARHINDYPLTNKSINSAGSDYSGGGEEEKFELRQVPKAILDWKIVVAAITDVTISMPRESLSFMRLLELCANVVSTVSYGSVWHFCIPSVSAAYSSMSGAMLMKVDRSIING